MAAPAFTRYEEARIIGARALQIAMGAPILIPITQEELEALRYSSIEIAKKEYLSSALPMTIKRPLPLRAE